MEQVSHLWLYFLVVFGIIVLPGMDMAFVLASTLTGGRKAGTFAVAGIVVGGICHVAASALGIGLLFRLVPGLVDVMLVAGALYIAWIGVSLVRAAAPDVAEPIVERGVANVSTTARRSSWTTFRQAAFTCLLNPKAYLFMLAIFPQFLRVEYGPMWIQAMALGAITALTQIAVYGGVAIAAGSTRGWLAQRPAAAVWTARLVGGMLLVGALITAVGVMRTH